METNTLNEYNELQIGDKVGSSIERIVIVKHKTGERIVGETYASWVAICYAETAYHPFTVWNIIARPEGWHAESGSYVATIEEALDVYKDRGGK
jgi:hypothetical protein